VTLTTTVRACDGTARRTVRLVTRTRLNSCGATDALRATTLDRTSRLRANGDAADRKCTDHERRSVEDALFLDHEIGVLLQLRDIGANVGRDVPKLLVVVTSEGRLPLCCCKAQNILLV
jgi:hypothetical protein